MIFSCRKDYKGFFNGPEANTSPGLEAAKIFYAKGAYLNSATYNELFTNSTDIGKLSTETIAKKHIFYKLKPLWKDAFELKAHDGSELIIVPTKENKLVEKTINIKRFFIFTKKGGSVVDGKIVEFLGHDYPLEDKLKELLANYNSSRVGDLTGAIFIYDLNYFLLKGELVKQGQRTGEASKLTNMEKAAKSTNLKTNDYCSSCEPNICYELSWCWYANGKLNDCTFTGYSDGCYLSPPSTGGGGGTSGYDSSSGYQSGGGAPYAGNPSPPPVGDQDIALAIPVIDSKPPIDAVKYKECFTDGKTASQYKLTIYVDQPVAGQNDQWSLSSGTGNKFTTSNHTEVNVGHAFVGFQKINTDGTSVTQVMGFYPGSSSVNTKGVIKDDSGHPYDVSYTATVSETKFTIALNDVISASGIKNYILSTVNGGQEFNCTDAAISWMTTAAVVLPADASSVTSS